MGRAYRLNEERFLSVSDEETAYWLGFLFADGSVVNNVLKIGLSAKDEDHLYKLREFLGSNQPLYAQKSKNICTLAIGSKKLVDNLVSLGCTPRKTFTLTYPREMPKHLDKHFIRGLFDGDGSIGIYDRIDNRKTTTYFYKELKFRLCGTKSILLSIQVRLEEELGIITSVKPFKNIYMLYINRFPDVKKSLDYLYGNATIYLTRKHKQHCKVMVEVQKGSPRAYGVKYTRKKELDAELLASLYKELKSCRAVVRRLRKLEIYTSCHTIACLLREHGVEVPKNPSGWKWEKKITSELCAAIIK